MNKYLRNIIAGVVAVGVLLIGGSALVVDYAQAQTTPKKTTVVKKPTAKKVVTPVKKTAVKKATKVVAKPVAAPFLTAGWIPYWTKTAGGTETTENLAKLDIISPFSYYVDQDGTLIDRLKINQAPWPELIADAKSKKIKVYPTIAWFDRVAMYKVLSDKNLREAHVFEITSEILDNASFDGVDIDYENKSAETKEYFSIFLKDLSKETKSRNKKLICTIEPRTPIDSRVRILTAEKIADSKIVSNDYIEINKYCDQVRIMTYDQRSADVKLSDKYNKVGSPYMPVSDPEWVEKVVALTIKDIAPSKIMLGVPTFGYRWEITPDSNGGYDYTKLRAINFREAYNQAKEKGIDLKRNQAGELSYVYTATGTQSFAGAAAEPVILTWFPDAESMLDKTALAKKYKLGGIAVFKFDGGADQSMWDVLKGL